MSTLLLALLFGCPSAPPPPPPPANGVFPEVTLPEGPSTDVYPLHLRTADATWELADANLPEGLETHEVTVDLAQYGGRRPHIPLPFQLDAQARARIGLDLQVFVDGREFRFAPLGGSSNTWRLLEDDLVVGANRQDRTLTMRYAGGERLLARRSLARSGLAPSEFVRTSLTLEGRTLPGLMLTTPSSGTWRLTVPARSPRFRATTSLMPRVVDTGATDGTTLELVVRAGGEETVVAERKLSAPGFREWEADLGPWAGRSVELVLRTTVTGTPDHDYAFVGAPTVWGTPEQEVRRVLVIGLDTTRTRDMGWYGYDKPTTPELDALANTSMVAVNAWTPAPRTRPSFRTATTGRYPLLAVGATNIGEVFASNGFATAGFVANIHLQPR
ncbi:MAG: sulfatase-like hydrolase/transferase, partial [Myxococcales bacterium]|nr:sulfatase-like hydrolase/transferase [Myxococcales bacterium]